MNNLEDKNNYVCKRPDVRRFVMYLRGELSEEEKLILDYHCNTCEDCNINFIYIREILEGKHPLSITDQTLLLKYTCDPLWHLASENARNRIKREILKEVGDIIELVPKKEKKEESPKVDITQQFATTKVIFTVATCICLLLLVHVFLVFGYPYFPSELTSVSTVQAIEVNLYDQLDKNLNIWLKETNLTNLSKVTEIAKEIQKEHKDPYGTELVAFYSLATAETRTKLQILRTELKELSTYGSGSEYEKIINRAKLLEEEFLLLGDKLESLRAKIIVAKISRLAYKADSASIANEGLKEVSGYPYLKIYFRLWEAKSLLDTERQKQGEALLREILEEAKKLHLEDIEISAGKSLVTILYNANEDKAALIMGQALVDKESDYQSKVSLLQVCSASAYKLKLNSLSKIYIDKAFLLAREHSNNTFISACYLWQGIMLTESGKYSEAEESYQNAIFYNDLVIDDISKLDLTGRIAGYQGKNNLAQRDYLGAIKHYETAIKSLSNLGLGNNIELAQLNEGLATALTKTGNSNFSNYYAMAFDYLHKGEKHHTQINCLFSFVPTGNCG